MKSKKPAPRKPRPLSEAAPKRPRLRKPRPAPQAAPVEADVPVVVVEDAGIHSERLQKVLAATGIGSRREIETWIEAGRVYVNGELAKLGDRVTFFDRVNVDGKPVRIMVAENVERRVLIYNKPEGVVTTRKDPEGRPTVFQTLPKIKGQRWVVVGRLDINTSGLLLFTTDGELARRLMHPSQQVVREYAVRVLGQVDDDMLTRLQEGVLLDDGMARFESIVDAGGTGSNHWYHVTLIEGRNREVRRLWDSQGLTVSRLKRIRYGVVTLPSRVKLGQWEELKPDDVDALGVSVGLEPKPRPKEKEKGKKRPSGPPSGRSSTRADKPRRGDIKMPGDLSSRERARRPAKRSR